MMIRDQSNSGAKRLLPPVATLKVGGRKKLMMLKLAYYMLNDADQLQKPLMQNPLAPPWRPTHPWKGGLHELKEGVIT